MFSQTAEYALRAMAFLAERSERPRAIPEIASATQVPSGLSLSKVMQSLVKSWIGRGVTPRDDRAATRSRFRRRKRRFWVSSTPWTPFSALTHCPLGLPQHAALCPLHRRLDAAAAHVEAAFQNTSLADLLGEPIFPEPKS